MQRIINNCHISDATNIQQAAAGADMRQMGCLKACVMKRLDVVRVILIEQSIRHLLNRSRNLISNFFLFFSEILDARHHLQRGTVIQDDRSGSRWQRRGY